jgi:CDP-4-dehydro-6-deoxyglucose reductase
MKARLLAIHALAPEVAHFDFDVPEAPAISYVPGQFFSFTDKIAGKQITRAYSIASPPSGNRFSLCLNRVKDGLFSPRLFELQPGDAVEFKGPYGAFILRQPVKDSVFVAAGTGIAPFRAMIQAHVPSDFEHRFTLLFGARFEDGIYYRDEFEAISRSHPAFRFWPTLTRPDAGWSARTGRVQEHLLEALGERRDIDVYICGLKEMVNDLRARLKDLGFDRKQIIFERYD